MEVAEFGCVGRPLRHLSLFHAPFRRFFVSTHQLTRQLDGGLERLSTLQVLRLLVVLMLQLLP